MDQPTSITAPSAPTIPSQKDRLLVETRHAEWKEPSSTLANHLGPSWSTVAAARDSSILCRRVPGCV